MKEPIDWRVCVGCGETRKHLGSSYCDNTECRHNPNSAKLNEYAEHRNQKLEAGKAGMAGMFFLLSVALIFVMIKTLG